MNRYIVTGHWCEVIASLHCYADSHREAMIQFINTFTEDQLAGLDIEIIDIESYPQMNEFFNKGSFYSGMYQYIQTT